MRAYAVAEGVSKSELVRRIIAAWVRERVAACKTPAGGVFDTLNHISHLIQQMELRLYRVELASESPKVTGQAPQAPRVERRGVQPKREELFQIAMRILKEAAKLAESEELAAKAKARMNAMQLATQASFAAECILRDYEREEVVELVNDVAKTNERLKNELKECKERAARSAPAT